MKRTLALILALAAILMLAACGAKKEFAPDLDALYEKILAETGTADMTLLSDRKITTYMGLEPEDYTKAIVAICGDSVLADEIWLVEAKDEAACGRIVALAQERVEVQSEAMKNYLPDQYEVLRQAKLLQQGKYMALFVSPEAAKMQSLFENA